jgi:hypothetical protein
MFGRRFVILNWASQLVTIAFFGLFEKGTPSVAVFNLIFANANSLVRQCPKQVAVPPPGAVGDSSCSCRLRVAVCTRSSQHDFDLEVTRLTLSL